jgi:hypothetical protein
MSLKFGLYIYSVITCNNLLLNLSLLHAYIHEDVLQNYLLIICRLSHRIAGEGQPLHLPGHYIYRVEDER